MGIDLTSALMIQGNETMVSTYSNKEETGYGFIVYLMKEGEIHTKIVSTLPNFPYESRESARDDGDSVVKQVRDMDLSPQKKDLQGMIGEETCEVVKKVVDRSKNPRQ
jgi:hypothetical protein